MVELAIVTPSYRGDFEHAVQLCQSIDRHLKGSYEHLLIVPRCDVHRFGKLAGLNRKILAAEDILRSAGLYRLPLPTRLKMPPFFNLRIREQWVSFGGRRVTGWIVQQIIKLSSPAMSAAPVFVFADSDVVLFRDISLASFKNGDAVVLQEHSRGVENETHRNWRRNARLLLGLPERDDASAANYIGNLIAWRRENVILLQNALADQAGTKWQNAIVQIRDVSEYILYGVFSRELLGKASLHTFEDVDNSLSIWTAPTGDLQEEALARLTDTHVCLHLQSTLSVAPAIRRQILNNVYQAAQQRSVVLTEGSRPNV